MGTLIAFAYYGGKYKHLADILPLLPAADHYCEPFCGSAAVLLNRKPSPIETISDLNADITNFFKILRENGPELIAKLELTPYSRQEFQEAWEYHTDPVENARRFFVRLTMDIAKAGKRSNSGWSANVKFCPGQHSYTPQNFINKINGLPNIISRLRTVQIENRPAIEIINKYDRPETLFYCDPPYLAETRTSADDYKYEMSIDDHRRLAKTLNKCKGKVAISGYDAPAMEKLYPSSKWYKTAFKTRRVPMSKSKNLKRQEILWTNYDPLQLYGQSKLIL